MLSCMDRKATEYCTACWSGDYRIDLEHPITDIVAEREQLPMFR
jgi:amidophosphoribosyltransferase